MLKARSGQHRPAVSAAETLDLGWPSLYTAGQPALAGQLQLRRLHPTTGMTLARHRLTLSAWALAATLALQPILAQQPRPNPREVARQEALRRDALRLAELASELQKEIEKSNENVLSVTILRKAAEVERLAHGLRERAKE